MNFPAAAPLSSRGEVVEVGDYINASIYFHAGITYGYATLDLLLQK